MKLLTFMVLMMPFFGNAYEYTTDFNNPFTYCEGKDGELITYGDSDRMIGLAQYHSYSFEWVQQHRERLMKRYCISFEELLEEMFDRQEQENE